MYIAGSQLPSDIRQTAYRGGQTNKFHNTHAENTHMQYKTRTMQIMYAELFSDAIVEQATRQ